MVMEAAAVVVGGVKGSGIYVRLRSFLPPPVITRRPQWGAVVMVVMQKLSGGRWLLAVARHDASAHFGRRSRELLLSEPFSFLYYKHFPSLRLCLHNPHWLIAA